MFDYFINPHILKPLTKKIFLIIIGLAPFLLLALLFARSENAEYLVIIGIYSICNHCLHHIS